MKIKRDSEKKNRAATHGAKTKTKTLFVVWC